MLIEVENTQNIEQQDNSNIDVKAIESPNTTISYNTDEKAQTHLQIQKVLIKHALNAVLNSSCVKLPKAIMLARVFGDALLFLNVDILKLHNKLIYMNTSLKPFI